MNLRQRLIFLLTPLLLLPLLLVLVFINLLFEQVTATSVPQLYQYGAISFVLGMAVLLTYILMRLADSIAQPITRVTAAAECIAQGKSVTLRTDFHQAAELNQLTSAIDRMQNALTQQQQALRDAAAQVVLGDLAAKVAHDVAGPLTSLNIATDFFHRVPALPAAYAKYTNLMALGVKRLEAITNGLLEHRQGATAQPTLFSLHLIFDELLGEYTAQDRCQGVTFVKQYHVAAIHLYGVRSQLQRALGNLVKNALEAMDYVGSLTISTTCENDHALITLEDTGCGMTPETIARIAHGGVSVGKTNGHGIGLCVVRDAITDFGGTLSITSEQFIGTTFHVCLPLPTAELSNTATKEHDSMERIEIPMTPGAPLIIIDDDSNMHAVWRLRGETAGRVVHTFSSYEDFLCASLSATEHPTIIVDYHFDNSEWDGLRIIEQLRAHGFTALYLCTAEYWKPSLQQHARDAQIPLCPKPLPPIEFVEPVEVTPTQTESSAAVDASPMRVLVIDDDEGIRFAWEIEQEKLGIAQLHLFASMEAFLGSPCDVRNIDIAFVDKHVKGSAWKLLDTVRDLKSRGIPRVIIASGESPTELRQSIEAKFADGVASPKIPESLATHLEAPLRLRVVD